MAEHDRGRRRGAFAHTVFRHLTWCRCGNNCAGNCNAQYRAWRTEPTA